MSIVAPEGAAGVILAPGDPRTWCYLGRDQELRLRIRTLCGDDVSIGTALTDVALRVKQPFLDWLARLGRRQPDAVRWWASAIASKSPLQSDIFFLVCYGEMLAAWAGGGSPADVVVVEDPWLLAAAREWLRGSERVQVSSGHGESLVEAASGLRRLAWRRRLTFAIRASWAALAARSAMSRHLPILKRPAALIFTWIEARAFLPDGMFRDPYTGRLAAILERSGLCVARLTPLAFPRALWSAMRISPERFIATPAFVEIGDVLSAAGATLRIEADANERALFGRDHGLLLEREQLMENASHSFREHLLGHAAVRRIAARLGGAKLTVIYPFENQPHEKLLCLAWREAAPDATLVGYVTAGIPSLLLSFFLGAGEADYLPLPDTIVANGPASRDLLAVSGYPADRLVDGGAFRFEHLAGLSSSNAPRDRTRAPQLLVPLPTVGLYARELLASLTEVFREPLIDPATRQQVRCVVTFHVDLPRDAVVDAPLPPSISLSAQPIAELLTESALCLFVPPTGSWREALIAGVPVLRYRPETLDLDPIDALGGLTLPVCSRATLREAIVEGLGAPRPSPTERARLLSRLYSPVGEPVWRALAGAVGPEEPATMKGLHES